MLPSWVIRALFRLKFKKKDKMQHADRKAITQEMRDLEERVVGVITALCTLAGCKLGIVLLSSRKQDTKLN
jgi:hypothetical protein